MSSQPQTVTIAQARASTASGLMVADTAINIAAALPNAALTARIASFTVVGNASLSAAQMSLLFPITAKLHATPGSLALSGTNAFTAAQLASYEALPGFNVSPTGSINLTDTTAQVVNVLATHPAWFAQISGVTIRLDGTSVGAYPASQLNGLLVHGKTLTFVPSPGHTVLNIAAAAHDLATNAPALNALGTHQALSFSVTNDGAGISAADAAGLSTLQRFSPAAHTLFVSDTGANIGAHLALIGQGFAQIQVASGTLSATAAQLLDPSVHFLTGAHAQLAASATLNAAAASSLAALPSLTEVNGAVLSVADSVANLVATSTAWQSAAGFVSVNADAVVSAITEAGLSRIASSFGTHFSLFGHSLTVFDTLPALLGLSTQAASLANAVLLSANATATTAQFAAFQALPHSGFAGHTIAIADSATNLLAIAGADPSHVSSVSLTSDAVVSVAQMLTLAAGPNFSAVGHALTIADTAANLLTLPSNVLHLANAVELSADATLGAAAAQMLTGETGYTADAHLLTIADSATLLANLAAPVLAFAANEQVSVSATIGAATAAALASLPHLTEAAGVTLTVQDSMSNLLAATISALAVAGAVRLVPGSTVLTDVAHAASLAAIPGFSSAGATITVSDSIAHLNAAATAAWSTVAATHAVLDSADALVVAAGSPLLTSATSVALATPAVVTASAAATLAGMPNFSGAAQLSVADSAAALIAHASSLIGLGCAITVTDSATVSASGAVRLAQIATSSGPQFSFGLHTLTIADTVAGLLSLTPAQAALAAAVNVTTNATVTAAQFTALRVLPHVSLSGHVLTVSDTAASLANLNGDLSLVGATTLSADANVTVARLALLTAMPNFTAAGHILNVVDNATNLLSISPSDLSQVASLVLSTDATVSAPQAQLLTAEPGFSTAGHQLTIADTAEHLLALPHSLLLSASSLALSNDQNVTAATLNQLTALGIKFTEAGHFLTCIDSAANLASLSAAAVALAHAEVLDAGSVVTASVAATLASLPGFSLTNGISLTVQDSVANLISLGQGVPVGTTAETLAVGSTPTITAHQAVALASLPHFTALGATITVTDTIANLDAAGSTVLQTVASTINISDTAANLAANAAAAVVQAANVVNLSGNAVVSASVAAAIASIPHFSAGVYQLEVMDGAANIAMSAAAVTSVATSVLVTDSGPISAAMADRLALISEARTLSFQGGNQLLVQDSYAALTNLDNNSGLALASRIGVMDTPANLVTASSHNWGALNPSFTLSQGGAITASTAMALAALGPHFSTAGYHLTVADVAASVVGAAATINGLHLTVSVTDSAANLNNLEADLLGLGSAITQVVVSDVSPLSASVASGLSGLAGVLAGPTLQVAGSAMDVQASISGLALLADHIAITVTDTAADIAPYANTLASLRSHLTVSLTDSAPVSATIAAALAPVAAQFSSIQLAITDTGANVAANAGALTSMGASIGTITLSDGNTQAATEAAALALLDRHLGAGIMITVTGTAADVAMSQGGLAILGDDNRLAAVLVMNTTVSDVAGQTATLNAFSASVSIRDSAVNVDAGLTALSQVNNLQSISLTDSGTATLSMTVASLASSAATLAKITTPYTITIDDTAAHITADLASGVASAIIGHLGQIAQVQTNDSQPVMLNQAQLLASNIDDGPRSALAILTGTLHAVDVDVAHLAQVASLAHPPTSVAVAASSADISQDLALGDSSIILGCLSVLSRIDVSDGQAVSLTAEQLLHAGVDDGPHSALGLMSSPVLAVTGASVADLSQLAMLYAAPATISVADTAANLSADLASGNSAIVADLPTIVLISVTNGMTISLSEQQVLAAGVDDSINSALAKAPGARLAVDHVTAADIAMILGLSSAPSTISITDTAAHIVSSLDGVLSNLGAIASIDVSAGTIALSAGEALEAHADDGPGSFIDRLAGHAFDVVGASIRQLPMLTSLPCAPAMISVNDSCSNIIGDLQSGHSLLEAAIGSLGVVSVTHGTLTMTDAQAYAILTSPSLDAVMGHLASGTTVAVTGVPISDLAAIASSSWSHVTVAVLDDASAIAADLASQNPVLQGYLAAESSVTLSAGGVIGATALTAMAALPHFQTGGFTLTVQDTAAAILGLAPAALSFAGAVHVSDTAAVIGGSLDALQQAFGGALTITLTDTTPTLTITALQYVSDQATIDTVTTPGAFTVGGSAQAVAQIAGILASDSAVSRVVVNDSAYNVIGSLPNLSLADSKLHVSLTDISITANLVAPLLNMSNVSPAGLTVIDTGSQIAALIESGTIGTLAYLNNYGASLSSDSVVTAADAAALESLGVLGKAGHTLVVWDTAQHLCSTAYATTLSNVELDSVHLKANGGSVIVTAAQAATLFAIPNFSTTSPSGMPNALVVSDTAAHIEAALSTLAANASRISNIVVNNSAIVNDQTLNDLQNLGASPSSGVAISVRDSAAIIAANAASQVVGQTILPASWTLSGNSTVSEADALKLGGLAHFSAGSFTITVSLGADTTISIADANKLGTLAGALNLNGHQLQVTGSVAQLSTLSGGAMQIVTPVVVDTAENVAALSPSSTLLLGTVEIVGSETLNAATATALLNSINSGNGAGIVVNALSFDSAHSVSDTVANLQALTSSAGWINNPTTHSSLHLTAQDLVSNLLNPASRAFLSGLTSTTLTGDATISVTTANALAGSASAIHFDRGAFHIVVQGSAADIVNQNNAGGIDIADIVQLNGPAHIDAMDAEALLSISHLNLNTTLTISDSSINLLDGTLKNSITSSGFGEHIVVQLAGPEALDAQTAESLVSIPGFADAHNLSISDEASYLLDTYNLGAEQLAAEVTLAGDETVTANTVLRLTEVPHFTPGDSHLVLSSNDFANALTIKAIADVGSAFDPNGHTITLTSDVMNLTPQEFIALTHDSTSQNGHMLGVVPTAISVTDIGNTVQLSGIGVVGSTVKLFGSDGSLVSSVSQADAGFTISADDVGHGHNFSLTESAGGISSEGAPIVILDSGTLETSVATAGGSFASTGQIQVSTGKFVDLYEAGSIPISLNHAALVYDPVAHTVALDLPGQGLTTLVTLGGSTHVASLDASEILFKLHG